MPFSKIIGHQFQKEVIAKAIQGGRLSHAYLFSGPEGVGKRLFALEMAKLLNCRGEEGSGSAGECGCSSCSKIGRGLHPDVFVVEYRGAKDIKIQQIREEVEERVQASPFEGRYKVAVIDDAHRMNRSAQNAFLKTLEEPPAHTVLILVTSEPESLLPTIRSRCQTFVFSPLPDELVAEELQRRAAHDEKGALTAAKLSRGSLGRALRLDAELLEFRREVIGELAGIHPQSGLEVIEFAEKMPVRGSSKREQERLAFLFDVFATLLEDALWLKLEGEREGLEITNSDLLPALRRFAEGKSPQSIAENMRLLEKCRSAIFNANANKQLVLENLVISLTENANPP